MPCVGTNRGGGSTRCLRRRPLRCTTTRGSAREPDRAVGDDGSSGRSPPGPAPGARAADGPGGPRPGRPCHELAAEGPNARRVSRGTPRVASDPCPSPRRPACASACGPCLRSTGWRRRWPGPSSPSAARSCTPAAPAAGDLVAAARRRLRPSLRRVLNATGVVVHTNLGPRAAGRRRSAAVAAVAAGYSEPRARPGQRRRGSRHDHVEALLRELTGAEAALAVNNCAAAVLLAVAALAAAGPRGDRLARAAHRDRRLVPHPRGRRAGRRAARRGGHDEPDPRRRLPPRDRRAHRRVLRAHPSNFRTVGFVEEVDIEALCGLGVAVIDDVGSGRARRGPRAARRAEPAVRRSVRAGAAVVCFSGDKLLGGPQAGLLVGRTEAIARRAAPSARPRAAHRQALARGARGDAAALPRPRARAPRAARCWPCSTRPPRRSRPRARRLADGSGGEVVAAVAQASAAERCRCSSSTAGRRARSRPGGADALAAALRAGDPPSSAASTRAGCCSTRARSPTTRPTRRSPPSARRARERHRRAAHPRHRRPHRPRQDRARRAR